MRIPVLRVLALLVVPGLASAATTFVRLAPNTYANARAISADGTVVVGNTVGDAFRWSAATGLQLLGAGFTSIATGVSGDGSVVVGNDPQFPDGYHFFRWTSPTGRQYIARGQAADISADGTTIVGSQFDNAFRWTSATGLIPLPGFSYTSAEAVSADGSVIAGSVSTTPSIAHAGRWTAATGWVDLGLLPGGSSAAFPVASATAMSANGAVLGGFSATTAPSEEAFRWTQSSGMVRLDNLPVNNFSRVIVRGISADGSVLVGEGEQAFIWTAWAGTQDLRLFLVANGATGLDGWNLFLIGGITPDGRFITGSGSSPSGNLEAWIAEIEPFPPPAAVDDGPIAVIEGVATVIPVGANDTNFTDPVTVTVTGLPTKGTISAVSAPGSAAGMTITYTANNGAVGQDSFVYSMTDGTPASDSASVTVNISPASSGGGGGALDGFSLLALGLMGVMRRKLSS